MTLHEAARRVVERLWEDEPSRQRGISALGHFAIDPDVRDAIADVLCSRYPCCDHDSDLDEPTCVADADAIVRALGQSTCQGGKK